MMRVLRLPVILLLLCGGALAASPRVDTPSKTPAVEAPAEAAAPEEGTAGEKERDKRQWFGGGFNPNPGFYPRAWWGNNYANYAAFGGFGGRSGMSPNQMQQYMQQMNQFMNNPPPVIYTGPQFGSNSPAVINAGARSGVRPNNNFLPEVIDTGAGGSPFVPMPMLHFMYSNGFAPPFRANQPAMFQRSWQQYFSQFTNGFPGATFDLRPQREVNSGSMNGMDVLNSDS